ncbi:hypothetical protein BpHYR1_017406, partial [Brachionus plicatilis]
IFHLFRVRDIFDHFKCHKELPKTIFGPLNLIFLSLIILLIGVSIIKFLDESSFWFCDFQYKRTEKNDNKLNNFFAKNYLYDKLILIPLVP